MLAISGYGSKIAQELKDIVEREEVDEEIIGFRPPQIPEAERYVFTAGFQGGRHVLNTDFYETDATLDMNFRNIVWVLERLFQKTDHARVCVIGSESGIVGSWDKLYAGAKAALHQYVETKALRENQQLVCLVPWIIEDAGMTMRRTDLTNLAVKKINHPKKRFLKSAEVARFVHFLLYIDLGYTTNCVIRMNGGGHAL